MWFNLFPKEKHLWIFFALYLDFLNLYLRISTQTFSIEDWMTNDEWEMSLISTDFNSRHKITFSLWRIFHSFGHTYFMLNLTVFHWQKKIAKVNAFFKTEITLRNWQIKHKMPYPLLWLMMLCIFMMDYFCLQKASLR